MELANPQDEAQPAPGTDGGADGSAATDTDADAGTDASTLGSGDGRPPGQFAEERLHRGRERRMLAGVAVGLADYFDIDPTLVRVGFVVLAFMGGLAIPVYLAGWLLIPEEGAELSVAEDLLAHHDGYGHRFGPDGHVHVHDHDHSHDHVHAG
jgi:phage shock protein PspC (stress-responsive transcriptional regulator)